MIQIDDTLIKDIILHRVTLEERSSVINNQSSTISDEENALFKKLLLKPFLSHASTYEFSHSVGLEYNVLFQLSKAIYDSEDFVTNSGNIARHLLSVSKHPNIKTGDLFIAKFEDIRLGNKFYEGLGVYKFEDKESYIETTASNNSIGFNLKQGIGNKKPDKACLILFTEEPYTLLTIDSNSSETDYWQNEFIGQRGKSDSINQTTDFLIFTKSFITEQIPQEFQVTKADQIDLLNRSVEFFKNHDNFIKEEFEQTILGDPNLIAAFNKFDKNYRDENDIELLDHFQIAPESVKKQGKIFKSVLKLDKNFHIYIHGNRDLIQPGIDESGNKFYKIFYDMES